MRKFLLFFVIASGVSACQSVKTEGVKRSESKQTQHKYLPKWDEKSVVLTVRANQNKEESSRLLSYKLTQADRFNVFEQSVATKIEKTLYRKEIPTQAMTYDMNFAEQKMAIIAQSAKEAVVNLSPEKAAQETLKMWHEAKNVLLKFPGVAPSFGEVSFWAAVANENDRGLLTKVAPIYRRTVLKKRIPVLEGLVEFKKVIPIYEVTSSLRAVRYTVKSSADCKTFVDGLEVNSENQAFEYNESIVYAACKSGFWSGVKDLSKEIFLDAEALIAQKNNPLPTPEGPLKIHTLLLPKVPEMFGEKGSVPLILVDIERGERKAFVKVYDSERKELVKEWQTTVTQGHLLEDLFVSIRDFLVDNG